MYELVVVLQSKDGEVIKLWRDEDLDFYIERNGERRLFRTDAKSLSGRVREVDDWLHCLLDDGSYEVVYLPMAEKSREELMPIIKDRLDALLEKSLDYHRKYAFVYLERYILDKHFLDYLFENFEEIRKQMPKR
jgi:hypothetical protein